MTVPTVQNGVEISVPLNKLKRSPRNARRTPHAASDVEALAASISAKGLLQPPVVEAERDADGQETGAYLVTIGEGRRLALTLLAKRKQIAKAAPVRCLLDSDNDAFEISLDENVTRFAMHPADQFEAFRELAETKGWGAEEIGARFGISGHTVRQRLRLASVAPALLAAYRAGDLSLEQVMAFAVSEDHTRQEQVYEGLSYNRSPSLVRRLLTEHEVKASDRRAVFVGTEAYAEAGGRIRRDLFTEDRGGWFQDVALLERLVVEKLASAAEAVRANEGWLWTEVHLDYPHDHGLRRVYPEAVALDEATEARLAVLTEEYDAIIAEAECSETGELPVREETRLREIDAELDAAYLPRFAPEVYGRAGAFVVLGHDGVVRIERGFIRPENDVPCSEPDDAIAGDAPVGSEEVPAAKPLSERLIADLTAHRTAALRDVLGKNPEAAHLAALHALVLPTFYGEQHSSCLELQATSTNLRTFADRYDESVAAQGIETRHAAWGSRLPTSADDAWEALCDLSTEDRMALFAHCVSLSINAVKVVGRSARTLAQADQLAGHVDLDMTQYWKATVDSFFGRISKAQIVEVVSEAVGPHEAAKLASHKKDAMAKVAADLLQPRGWLPPLLRKGDPD